MDFTVTLEMTATGFGFFPGLAEPVTIDSADMPAEDAEKVMQLVTDTDFFTLPPEVRGQSSIADMQQYTVTICQGEERENCHTVEVDYPAKDPQLQELLNVLRAQAKAQRTATPTGTPKAGPDQKP